ncbi:BQ5605_C018g08694 [Microbotryum silenes-dioicae]|uniref:BQ5605_C018g08694 protein n=1 Tax=Microbotryum silenes-dioicae TaxID=796604 RepID=A0A2X0MRP6_9BASI|nr:BQ5605_C018g08694 [Microbotryum silenes-dioicae]
MTTTNGDSNAASSSELAIHVEDLRFAYRPVDAPELEPVLEHVNLNLPKGARCILVGANGAGELPRQRLEWVLHLVGAAFDDRRGRRRILDDVARGVDLRLQCAHSLCHTLAHHIHLTTSGLAGKSTLLQILAGKRLTRSGAKVLGQDVFFSTPKGVTYLGTEWAANPVVRSDLKVSHFLDSVGGYRNAERRDHLLDIMDVDLAWRMHEVSDGERRRVQIVAGLMAPWDLLLLDEVTVDLDVLVRSRLLSFLIEETQQRNASILYATHIFDGLDAFPTHLCHIQLGSTVPPSPLAWPIQFPSEEGATVAGVPKGVRERMEDPGRNGSKTLELALAWLQQDRQKRESGEIARDGMRKRGAKEVTESEAFYRKYDYSH